MNHRDILGNIGRLSDKSKSIKEIDDYLDRKNPNHENEQVNSLASSEFRRFHRNGYQFHIFCLFITTLNIVYKMTYSCH